MRERIGLRSVAVAVAVAALFAVNPVAPASGGARRATQTISPGVTFKTLTESGPNRVFVLTVDPSRDATLDNALARPTLPGYARTSSIATAHNAVAAVNGDFGLSPGRPGHLYAEDGELVQTTLLGLDGKNFAVSQDETARFIDSPQVRVTGQVAGVSGTFNIEKWNVGTPGANAIAGYSSSGGAAAPTPRSTCSARLMPTSPISWAEGQSGVRRPYTVDAVACGASAMALNGGIVLAAQQSGRGADQVKALTRGTSVDITWTLGWNGVLDAMGGSPVLLKDGKVMVSACSEYLCYKHPRTAVGITSTGKVLLVVVDGRRSGYSIGMTLVQLANEMKKLGAVDAINLDGGGSATMWIRGKGVVNRPSDGSERYVTNALLVLPGRDSDEPNVARPEVSGTVEALVAPLDAAQQQAAEQAAYSDPASTGGLLDLAAG